MDDLAFFNLKTFSNRILSNKNDLITYEDAPIRALNEYIQNVHSTHPTFPRDVALRWQTYGRPITNYLSDIQCVL